MPFIEPSSMIGSAAGMCVEEGMEPGPPARTVQQGYRLNRRVQQPTHVDRVPNGTCRRCGLVGEHSTAMECIEGLRDRLAHLEG